MIVTCWIMLISFGFIAVTSIAKYWSEGISTAQSVLMFLSIIIVALCSGVIFGGIYLGGLIACWK